jgi:hypothetical protein
VAALRLKFGPEIARITAEFDRMQRRHEDERAARAASITEEAVKEMLPMMDTFFNAKVHPPSYCMRRPIITANHPYLDCYLMLDE